MKLNKKIKILWIDDEIDLLQSHIFFLKAAPTKECARVPGNILGYAVNIFISNIILLTH